MAGAGEMHLQTICDRAKLKSGAQCAAGPVLSPSSTTGAGNRPSDGALPTSLSAVGGGTDAADGSAKRIDPPTLAKLLVPVHWTLRKVNMCDAIMRANIAVRLVDLLTRNGSPGIAVDVARSSVADLEAARSSMIIELAAAV